VGELLLKLDHTNPTHSFKDRVVAVAAAKAAELATDTLACASTGNLGNAVAARAAALGMRSVVLYPTTVEPEKLRATAVYGGELVAVRGSYDVCSRLVVELASELDWAFVNVNLRPYYAEGSQTLAFGAPADGDLAVATAGASGGAIHSVLEGEVGSNMALLAQASGIFGETAAGVALGALRDAVASGRVGSSDRVVLVVTGTGLKTPAAVDLSGAVEIAPDVESLLEELGVAA